MKSTILFLSLLLSSITLFAESVKLKITYNGNGISGHDVTVMIGDAAIGSGTTDSDGNVTISVSSLPSKSINLKGQKTCEGAKKSWEVKGFVTLDGSNYAHLKMEEPIAEMVEASGGFMSEKMMVASYGLVCAGSSSSSSSKSNDGGSSDSGSSSSSSESSSILPKAEAPALMTKEEALANQKMSFENKIASLDNKMEKKQSKISSGKYEGDKKIEAEQDIEEMKIEKMIAQNDLDRVNLSISKGMLNKSERNGFKDEEKRLKEELKALKSAHKSGSTVSKEVKEEKESVESTVKKNDNKDEAKKEGKEDEDDEEDEGPVLVVTEADFADMGNMDLKKKKISLKSLLGKRKMKLKTRKNFLSPNELAELEAEIAQIEASLELIEAEIEKRGAEKEE